MLTRLKVTGFKNLIDVDVRFGPFTCIAGANGVGKSNLFDAITFLRLLADRTLHEAALSIRDERGKRGDVRSLFSQHRGSYAKRMRFEAEMLIPKEGVDHLGQPAQASNTFLVYVLEIGYRDDVLDGVSLEILEETLDSFNKGDAGGHLVFPHADRAWRDELVQAKRRSKYPFLSTQGEGEERVIQIHQDGNQGRPQPALAQRLPRTVLSSVSASEAPTAVVARNEMRAWKLLQFEPSALRQSDPMRPAERSIAADGAHMASTLFHLSRRSPDANGQVQQSVANRVAELVEDIADVWVDEDDKRELLTLHARMRDGTDYPARSLSDGTLRFLALAILERIDESGGLYCLEEPENGIHPARIPAMLRLLQDIACDPKQPAGRDNPLRQVIINTHAPAVVGQVPDDSLVVAEPRRRISDGEEVASVRFSALPNTWRTAKAGVPACQRGRLLGYLNPIAAEPEADADESGTRRQGTTRVVDRSDIQPFLPGMSGVQK
ncbi:AAA family ATPase [Haliangium sp.]|uniref:AAA family ATPase n=1 Tax=Haliangium sp. TaxID=2663208 RepID=UPI003D0E0111